MNKKNRAGIMIVMALFYIYLTMYQIGAENVMSDQEKLDKLVELKGWEVTKSSFDEEGNLVSLDLSGSVLTGHTGFTDFRKLTVVLLSGCEITDTNSIYFPLSVEEVDLSWNEGLKAINFKHLISLKKLDLSYSALEMVESGKLPFSLEDLNLAGNEGLIKLDLENMQNLTRLNSSDCRLTDITLSNLPRLSELYLRGNRTLASIELEDFPGLEKIDLSRANINQVNLGNMPEIKILLLNDNPGLREVDVRRLESLRELVLSYCHFHDVKKLDIPPNLLNLDLSHNGSLKSFTLKDHKSLEILRLINSSLEEIELVNLPALKHLDAGENKTLNRVILKNLSGLIALHLYSCGFTQLTLEDLPRVNELYLTKNPNLSFLNIKGLKELKKLVARDCDLTEVLFPPGIEAIDLQGNSGFTGMNLRKLKYLKNVNLKGTAVPLPQGEKPGGKPPGEKAGAPSR